MIDYITFGADLRREIAWCVQLSCSCAQRDLLVRTTSLKMMESRNSAVTATHPSCTLWFSSTLDGTKVEQGQCMGYSVPMAANGSAAKRTGTRVPGSPVSPLPCSVLPLVCHLHGCGQIRVHTGMPQECQCPHCLFVLGVHSPAASGANPD